MIGDSIYLDWGIQRIRLLMADSIPLSLRKTSYFQPLANHLNGKRIDQRFSETGLNQTTERK